MTDDTLGTLPTRHLRVSVLPSEVSIQSYALPFVNTLPEGMHHTYRDVSDLPEDIAKKIAVLSMFDPDDHPTPDVPGIGRRINRSVYWVYY